MQDDLVPRQDRRELGSVNCEAVREDRIRDYDTVTCTPERSIFIGRIWPPAFSTAFSTALRAPGSISITTQPPPPAPHTLPDRAPFFRAPSMMRSIVFVEIVGKLFFLNSHSSRINRPVSFQSEFSTDSPFPSPTSPSRPRFPCPVPL